MKKETLLLWLAPIVMVFIGLFAGFYFGIYRTSLAVVSCEASKSLIAPSLVVSSSYYNEKTNNLELTLTNPGAMPILVLDKTLVLKPADTTKQPVLIMGTIPLNMVIPAYSDVTLNLNLGKVASGFVVNDVLETTLTYQLPISNDVYALVHRFRKSTSKNEKGLIKNSLGNNKDKLNEYKKANQNSKK